MKKKNYTSKFLAVTVMVIMMLCAAPVMEHFGIDMGVSAHAAKSGYFTYEVKDGEAYIIKLEKGTYQYVTIPDTLGGYPVTTLGSNAFDQCNIGTFTIGKNAAYLYTDTFSECQVVNFKVASGNTDFSVDSNGVLYNKTKTALIRYPVFNESTSFTVPSTVQRIWNYAFNYAYYLKKIELPDSISIIESSAFACCFSLNSIDLPEGIKSIEAYTFYSCMNLASVKIPDSCTAIGESAFDTCISLQNITIPGSVNTIGEYAFEDCFLLDRVEIHSKNMSIEENALCMGKFTLDISDMQAFFDNWGSYCLCYAMGEEADGDTYFDKACELLTYQGGYVPMGTIYCYKGSTAETYAKNNGINYAYLSGNSADHTHSLTEIIIPSTCTEQGGRFVGCTQCDYIASYELYSLAPHTYKTKTTKATTSKNGKVVKACTVCGDVKSSKTIYKISSIKLSATSYTYNGKVKTPSVVIKDSKGNKLVKGTDYTVKYSSGRKAVGTYKVKITFMGKYSGTKTLSFKIVLGKVKNVTQNENYKGLYVSWNKVTGATGYQIYEYKNGSWKKLLTVKNKADGNYVHNKSVKGKVTWKMRAYYKAKDGTVHYGAWSTTNTFKGK